MAGSSGARMPGFLGGRHAVVWTRDYSAESEGRCDCEALEQALAMIPGARRMVVGHTIQVRRSIGRSSGRTTEGAAARLPTCLAHSRRFPFRSPSPNQSYTTAFGRHQKQWNAVGPCRHSGRDVCSVLVGTREGTCASCLAAMHKTLLGCCRRRGHQERMGLGFAQS
jgi:hypothetical protein